MGITGAIAMMMIHETYQLGYKESQLQDQGWRQGPILLYY